MTTGSYSIAVVVGLLFFILLVLGNRKIFPRPSDGSSVVVVSLSYAGGAYVLDGEVWVLTCVYPSRLEDPSESDSLVEVFGGENGQTVLYRERVRNPRIEGDGPGNAGGRMREAGSFTLFFPLRDGMKTLAFWEAPRRQREPSIVVDLVEAVDLYHESCGETRKQDLPPVSEETFQAQARGGR